MFLSKLNKPNILNTNISSNRIFDMGEDTNFEKENLRNENLRNIPPLTPKLLFLLLLSTFLFTLSGVFPFLIIPIIISAPIYSVLSFKMGNRFSLLPPIIAFILSLIITQNIYYSLTSLLAPAMAYAMSHAINQKPERAKTSAVIGCTIAFVIFIAFEILVYLILNDAFSSRTIANFINQYFEVIRNSMIETYRQTISTLLETVDISKLTNFEIPSMENIEMYVNLMIYQTKIMLPATLVVWLMFFSYISCSLLKPMAKMLGEAKMFKGKHYSITISGICLVVYFIISIGMIFSNGTSVYGFRNIITILSPAFMLCGIKQIGEFFKRKKFNPVAIFIVQTIITIFAFVLGNLGTTILTVLGMYYSTRNLPNEKI